MSSDTTEMIDIGVNLLNSAFEADLEAVCNRARAAGVGHMVITGTDLESSLGGQRLAATRPQALSSTAGVHPHDAGSVRDNWTVELEDLLRHPEVRAVGETGLDFNRNYTPRATQEQCFAAQLELARDCGKPLFVHERDTEGRVLQMLDEHGTGGSPVVIHCFTGSEWDLRAALERGFYIGITGWVCDERRGQPLAELIAGIPPDRLMIETDAPYLTPRNMPNFRRHRRNEPAFLIWVARRIAELRGVSVEQVIADSTATAAAFFSLPMGSQADTD